MYFFRKGNVKTILKKAQGVLLLVFVSALGITGSFTADISKVIFLFCLLVFGVAYFNDLKQWLKRSVYERKYVYGILGIVAYAGILFIVWSFIPNKYGLKPSYNALEKLLFIYVFMPLFCLLIGLRISQRLFERAMLFFSIGVVINSVFLLYAHYDITLLWDSPKGFLMNVLRNSFTLGEGCRYKWLNVWAIPYYPALGALVIVPFIFRRGWICVAAVLLFLINTLFLFLTNEKGGILGLCLGMLVVIVCKLKNSRMRTRIILGASVITACAVAFLFLPQTIIVRFVDMITEIKLFYAENHAGGSTSSRLTIWKILLSHAKDFWLFGDGPVYAKNMLSIYLQEAGMGWYVSSGLFYHDQYLADFHLYGIAGLLFLPFILLYPVYAMLRSRRFSYTLAAIILFFLFVNIADTVFWKGVFMALPFFLYFGFFQVDKWRCLEKAALRRSVKDKEGNRQL